MRYWKRKRWRNVAYIYVLENASNFTYTHLEYLRFWRVTPEESVISLADMKDYPIFWQRWIPWNEVRPTLAPSFQSEIGPRISIPILRLIG